MTEKISFCIYKNEMLDLRKKVIVGSVFLELLSEISTNEEKISSSCYLEVNIEIFRFRFMLIVACVIMQHGNMKHSKFSDKKRIQFKCRTSVENKGRKRECKNFR